MRTKWNNFELIFFFLKIIFLKYFSIESIFLFSFCFGCFIAFLLPGWAHSLLNSNNLVYRRMILSLVSVRKDAKGNKFYEVEPVGISIRSSTWMICVNGFYKETTYRDLLFFCNW